MPNAKHSFFSAFTFRLTSLLICLSLVLTLTAHAQRAATEIYAITNARIVTLSGAPIERGTVVIRDGLIASVGANVPTPADARIIDGTGLTVYPGFIDANTTLGVPTPAPTPARTGAQTGVPAFLNITATPGAPSVPNSSQPAGLQPELLAADVIQINNDQLDPHRTAGFTHALTAPRTGIFIGQSAVINLAGDSPQATILRSPVALHVGFTPLGFGQYPNSLMGVFAALRQAFLDARRYEQNIQIYERNPRGLQRPTQDKSLVALLPYLRGELPVVMNANSEREIIRALDLAQEFNLKLILAGGLESYKVVDRLRTQNVPVLLSLNFPRRTTASLPEADPEPLRILRERVQAPRTAAALVNAGVQVAFQSGGMTNISDFIQNAQKSVENNLNRDEALRAMTLRPAEIFGLSDRLGTIETGKIANLTVTRGDVFTKTTTVAHVFIDGRQIDLKPATPPTAPGAPGTGISGTYSLSIKIGQQPDLSVQVTLQQQGEQITGSLSGALGTAQIANASYNAQSGALNFTAPVNYDNQTTEANFTGTITGNRVSGTVQIVGREQGTFTGTRAGTGAPPSATPASPTPSQQPPTTAPPSTPQTTQPEDVPRTNTPPNEERDSPANQPRPNTPPASATPPAQTPPSHR